MTLNPTRVVEKRLTGMEWLRWYASSENWKPLGPKDDYQIFGEMRLSDLRAAIAAHDAQIRAVRVFLTENPRPYGAKAEQEDYVQTVSCASLTALHIAFQTA